jgi:hypothetical protein
MRILLIISAFLFFVTGKPTPVQVKKTDVSGQLEKLFVRLRQNFNPEKKLEINDSIRSIIDSYAASDTVFDHRFGDLRYLGQITSPDSLIKIITWNLILSDGEDRYFLFFIKRSDKKARGQVVTLNGIYNDAPIRSDTIYSSDNWYGALYYDTRPFIFNGRTYYILLGIDYGNSFITRKIIDVLSFDQDQKPIFGLNCFFDGKSMKSRIVFEYSANAVMSLKFEADNMIVFDHLSPVSTEYKDNHQFYGPDFSFDAYNYEKGLWRYKGDIDIRNK